MSWVYIDSNKLTAHERVYVDTNRLTADEVVYVSDNPLVCHKRVFIDDSPLTAHKRVYITSNKLEAGPAPYAPGVGAGGGGFRSIHTPDGLEGVVATIGGCFGMFGVIAWALAGGGGDPHAGRIPLVIFGGGALVLALSWLSGVMVDDGERFMLGLVWTITGIVSILVVADHHHAQGSFMSSAVVAAGVSMFVSYLVCLVVLVLRGKHHRRRPWFR